MKLDILVFAAHPDDAELSCGGTIIKHANAGRAVGIIDLTRGELGTRGSAEIRDKEAADAADIMSISVRENLGFADGFFKNDRDHQLEVIKKIRKYQPDIVLANAPADRHPDHDRAAALVKEAAFLSGLRKIETDHEGEAQQAWRPRLVLHYIQAYDLHPDIVVDISEEMGQKMQAIQAYKSQFYNPDSNEPETYISTKQFLESLKARAASLGQLLQVQYAEGFITSRYVGIEDLTLLK